MNYQAFIKTLEGATLSLPIDQDGRISYDFDSVDGGVRICCTLFDKDGEPFYASFDYVSMRYAYKVYQELQDIQYQPKKSQSK